MVLLEHGGDLVVIMLVAEAGERDAVDQHLAFVRLDQAEQDLDQGRFAAPEGPVIAT